MVTGLFAFCAVGLLLTSGFAILLGIGTAISTEWKNGTLPRFPLRVADYLLSEKTREFAWKMLFVLGGSVLILNSIQIDTMTRAGIILWWLIITGVSIGLGQLLRHGQIVPK